MTDRLEAIRYDYLTNRMSLSQLAQKYGMHKSSVNRLVKKYDWDTEKKLLEGKVVEAAKKKANERETTKRKEVAKSETAKRKEPPKGETPAPETPAPRVEMVVALNEYIDKEAERRAAIYEATDILLGQVRRMLKEAEGAMAPRDLQAMSSTLINIKQIQDIRPEEDNSSKTVTIRLEGALDDWAG